MPMPSSMPASAPEGRDDLADCRASLRHGSRSFFAASLLLPTEVRAPASALYAFCRMADDAVDLDGAGHAAVDRLGERLDGVYAGRPEPVAADRALAFVVARYGIPRALPEALLDGFRWDADGRRYETLAELQDYAARVAGSVGAMMALLMGVRSAEGLARACDLGTAMQLSNIARDVGEDARMGRLYLPRLWLREAGIDPDAWLARPAFTPALASVVRRLLEAADDLYRRVGDGVADLPLACRPGINAARFLYADIGHEVARRGFDSVSQRARVSRPRKARLLAQAMLALWPARAEVPPPCLPAHRFLIEAAATAPSRRAPAPWQLVRRFVRVIELFESLERRERGLQVATLPP